IELSRAIIASPHQEEQFFLMTPTNIPGMHSKSNLYYTFLLGSFRLSPCHEGEGRGLCQLSSCLIAHQYSLGARHLHAFEAAFRGSCSVLQHGAVGLQISILLRKTESVFSRDLGCVWKMRSQGLLAHNKGDARRASSSLCIEAEMLLPLSGWKA